MSSFLGQQMLQVIRAFSGQANQIVIPRPYIDFMGCMDGGALLSQIVYWSDRTTDPEGWFYKTYMDWEKEISLSEYQVRKNVKRMTSMEIVETKVKKVDGNPTLHYRLKLDRFSEVFLKFLQNGSLKKSRNEPEKTSGSVPEKIQGTNPKDFQEHLYTEHTYRTYTEPREKPDAQKVCEVDAVAVVPEPEPEPSLSPAPEPSTRKRDPIRDRFENPGHPYPELISVKLQNIWAGPRRNDFHAGLEQKVRAFLRQRNLPCELGDAKHCIRNKILRQDWGWLELMYEAATTAPPVAIAPKVAEPAPSPSEELPPPDPSRIRAIVAGLSRRSGGAA